MVAGGAEAGDLPPRHRRLRRGARAVDRLQRHAGAAPRAPGTRTATASSWARAPACVVLEELRAREEARRQDLCRGDRLRHVGRRLPHHRAGRGRQRRLPRHAGGAEARQAQPRRHRLHQRPRHLDAARRRDRARRGEARCSATPPTSSRCPRPSRRSAICWARPAASRRSSRILAIRDQVAPPTLNLENPSHGCDIDLVPKQAKQRKIRARALQLLRLRRHQRQPDLRRPAVSLSPATRESESSCCGRDPRGAALAGDGIPSSALPRISPGLGRTRAGMRWFIRLLFTLIVGGIIVAGAVAYWSYRDLQEPGPSTADTTVVIASGLGARHRPPGWRTPGSSAMRAPSAGGRDSCLRGGRCRPASTSFRRRSPPRTPWSR